MSGQGRVSPRGDLVNQLHARLEDEDAEINFLRGELMHRRLAEPQPLVAIDDMEQFFRKLGE